jgi:crossover junction endodeoxyribonuclease RusA
MTSRSDSGVIIVPGTAVLAITVPGRAAPQGSKRHVGRGVMIESSKNVQPFRALVSMLAANAIRKTGRPVPTGPIIVYVRVEFARPKSHIGKSGLALASAPSFPGHNLGDIDKIGRAVLDALTGIAFKDDSQVVELSCAKAWSDRDQTHVAVSERGHLARKSDRHAM